MPQLAGPRWNASAYPVGANLGSFHWLYKPTQIDQEGLYLTFLPENRQGKALEQREVEQAALRALSAGAEQKLTSACAAGEAAGPSHDRPLALPFSHRLVFAAHVRACAGRNTQSEQSSRMSRRSALLLGLALGLVVLLSCRSVRCVQGRPSAPVPSRLLQATAAAGLVPTGGSNARLCGAEMQLASLKAKNFTCPIALKSCCFPVHSMPAALMRRLHWPRAQPSLGS